MSTVLLWLDCGLTLSIGTKKAFAGGYEYNYRVADDINMYVCVIARQLPSYPHH